MRQFQYLEPESLDEACAMMAEHADQAALLAGGVSLVPLLKSEKVTPDYVIDIKNLPDLNYIRDDQQYVRIGALTTLSAMGNSPIIQDRFPSLVDMERNLFDVQTRNWGTLGGNLCYAGRAGEPAPVLTALGASAGLSSTRGDRTVALKEFSAGHRASVLQPDEMLVEVQIPHPKRNSAGAYCKAARRRDHSPIVNVATAFRLDDELARIDEAIIVLGGLVDIPVEAHRAEQVLIGHRIEDAVLDEAAIVAADEVQRFSGASGSVEYKRDTAILWTRRAMALAIDRCRGSKGDRQ